MSRAEGVESSIMGCKVRKVKSVDCQLVHHPPCHPRTLDFDGPCETGRLRARKRLTPWPEICHWLLSPQYSGCPRATSEFLFAQSNISDKCFMHRPCKQQATRSQRTRFLPIWPPCAVNIGLMSATAQLPTGGRWAFCEAARLRYLGGSLIGFFWQPLRISQISS